MKRWYLALAALLGGTVSLTYADYVVIRYNLSGTRQLRAGRGGQVGLVGQPGGGPLGGPGMGALGQPGGGPLGGPGRGALGGGPGGGGPLGGPGMGALGGVPGGGPLGGPGMANLGGQGALGGMGFPGGGLGGGEEDLELTPLSVLAVVETKTPPDYRTLRSPQLAALQIDHKWGHSTLVAQPGVIQIIPMMTGPNKYIHAVSKKYAAKYAEVHKESPPPVDKLLELAQWALGHGLQAEFLKAMEDLAAHDASNKAVTAFQQIQADLAKPVAENKDIGLWKQKLGMETYKVTPNEKGHYSLVHNIPQNNAPEVQRRLTRLEEALHGFYYWFALKGVALPVPQQRLLAVMAGSSNEFKATQRMFEMQTLVDDGFVSSRDNLMVLSTTPCDESYEDLRNYVEPSMKGVEPTLVLHGRAGDPTLQTAVLLLRAMEEEGEIATASHEGSRQLLAAAGLLPRSVRAPQWLEFGMGSFFETAKGSPWASLGASSTSLIDANNYLYTYKTWSVSKKLDPPKVALERVITDYYFRQPNVTKDPAVLHKARTTAWALTHFLAEQKLDGLQRYFKELSKLPRDMEIDDEALKLCFARAFGLMEMGKPRTINADRFAAVALEWDRFVNLLPLEVDDTLKELHRTASELKSSTGNQNQLLPGGGGGKNQGPMQ
jgi:hypothetical protein